MYAYLFWLRTPGREFLRVLFDTHLFVPYVYFWMVSGLRAIGRIITKKNGWAKTAPTKEAGPAVAAAAAPGPAFAVAG